eukprot:gene852-487_t
MGRIRMPRPPTSKVEGPQKENTIQNRFIFYFYFLLFVFFCLFVCLIVPLLCVGYLGTMVNGATTTLSWLQIYIYIYIYICVCLSVSVLRKGGKKRTECKRGTHRRHRKEAECMRATEPTGSDSTPQRDQINERTTSFLVGDGVWSCY